MQIPNTEAKLILKGRNLDQNELNFSIVLDENAAIEGTPLN